MVTIIDAIQDPNLFGAIFKNLASWSAWITCLKISFGLALRDKEVPLYQSCTGRKSLPQKAFKEVYLIVGRRGGKSFIVSVIAVFLAIFKDYRKYLAPGERGTIMIIATDRKQSGIILRYIKAILSIPLFKPYVERDTAEAIELVNGVNIEVHTCSYRAVRGYTIVAAIFEETAFWRVEGANPDHEVYTAIKPAMATIPNSLLISISTPYARQGLLYENYREYYGKDDSEVLIWKAPSVVMNPTLSEKMISMERVKDLSSARAEWEAEFREDVEAFLPLEVIERVIVPNRFELPPIKGISYLSFADPSGGGSDLFSLAIGHKEKEKVIQDVLRARKGDPYQATKEFCELLQKYGIRQTEGDKYAGQWVSEAFEKEGVTYRHAELTKSEIYLESLPYISSGAVELVDNREMVKQLRLLERRRGSSGKDIVDHPKSIRGGVPHDDLSNVTCGLIAVATKVKREPGVFFVGPGVSRISDEQPQEFRFGDRRIDRWLLGD